MSIEYSLMDPSERRRSTKCSSAQQYVLSGNSHACFARVIKIAIRIIVGEPEKKTNVSFNQMELHISGAQDEGVTTGVHLSNL